MNNEKRGFAEYRALKAKTGTGLADCAEELIADARDLLDKKIISEVLPIEKK